MKKFFTATLVALLMLTGISQASVAHAATTSNKIVTTGSPYLKSVPYSNKGETYGTVPKGTKLDVLEKTNKYYVKVNYKNKTGYISTKYIQYLNESTNPTPTPKPDPKPTPQPEKPTTPAQKEDWEKVADRIIANAKSMMGKAQYQYGKRDPANLIFDCSSFTQYLYKQEGINMKWGARAQFQGATEIPKSQLRKGDLVFTSTTKTAGYTDKVKKIGHVGIYMGDGKMINALNPEKDVTISDLNSSWFKKHYVTAARVIK